jgi:hypothetical protein
MDGNEQPQAQKELVWLERNQVLSRVRMQKLK